MSHFKNKKLPHVFNLNIRSAIVSYITIVALIILQCIQGSSLNIPSKLIDAIRLNILTKDPFCTSVNNVFQANSEFVESLNTSKLQNFKLQTNYIANIILPTCYWADSNISSVKNGTSFNKFAQTTTHWNIAKYHQPCSLVLLDIEVISQVRGVCQQHGSNNHSQITTDASFLFKKLPSILSTTFYVIASQEKDRLNMDIQPIKNYFNYVQQLLFISMENCKVENLEFGNCDIANRDIGDRDIGDRNIGDRDIGDRDIGDRDIGNRDIGDRDIGDRDIVNRDISDSNLGHRDIGDRDIGDRGNDSSEASNCQSGNRVFSLYKRNFNFEEYIRVGYFLQISGKLVMLEASAKLFPKFPNFHLNILTGVTCPFCEVTLDAYKELGVWMDFTVAAMYTTCEKLNATLELRAVVAIPTIDKNEDGQWDEFTAPLIDGSEDFSGIVKPTVLRKSVIYLSYLMYFDTVSFIHALPKRIQSGSGGSLFLILEEPLDTQVWLWLILSLLANLLALKLVFYFGERSNALPLSMDYLTLIALVNSLVDQSGLSKRNFNNLLRNGLTIGRLILSVWFITVIVVGCAYKSKLISAIVLPKFISPPQTFQELVESDYKIYSVFYSMGIREKFETIQATNLMAGEIMKRTEELSYMETDCFHLILDGSSVCMGLTSVFEIIGKDYLTDVKKQPLFLISKDRYFTMLGSMGISKLHPYCIDPINEFLSIAADSGIGAYGFFRLTNLHLNIGQQNARNWEGERPQFSSKTVRDKVDESSVNQLVALLWLLLAYGTVASSISFVAEIFLGLCSNVADRVVIMAIQAFGQDLEFIS